MIDKLELENLKHIYLKLSEDIEIINSEINNILYNINGLNLNNCCTINNITIDNGLVEKNKQELDFINNYLNNNVKNEILDLIVQINERINSR